MGLNFLGLNSPDNGSTQMAYATPQLPFRLDHLIVPERFEGWHIRAMHIGVMIAFPADAHPVDVEPFIVTMDERTEARLLEIERAIDDRRPIELQLKLVVPRRNAWLLPRFNLPIIKPGQDVRITVDAPEGQQGRVKFRAILLGATPNYHDEAFR